MRKKSKQSQGNNLVTKKYLDKKINYLDTKIDLVNKKLDAKIDLVNKRLDAKIDLVNKRIDRVIDYIDERLKPFEEMRKEFAEFKDRVLTALDWLIGAFKKFEEEHTILTGKYSEVSQRLNDHENRISALEKKTNYSS